MENRLHPYGFNDEYEEQPEQLITVELNANERLLRLILEMPDEDDILEDDLPEDFEGEPFIEHALIIREREYETFVKVLHYNKTRYRVETLR